MKKQFLPLVAGLAALAAVSCTSTPQPTELTWGTFNIRYDNPGDSLNSWTYRKDSVASFIRTQDMDIVGMQEVLHGQLEDLKERLPEYAEIGVGREDGKTQGEYAPLFYKKDRFEVLDSNTFWLSQYPDSVGFIGWDGACTRIATWAKLKDKQSGKIFMAVNTHFDHVGTEARRKGALLIIDKIKEIRPDVDQVDIDGKAILFESGIYAKIPSDLPEKLVMSALDVAGAPAQVAKLVRPGNTVLIIGAAGKSGMLCCYEARKRVGVTGKVIGLCYSPEEKERLDKLGFCHEVVCMDARQPIPVLEKITELTNGEMCDITINNVNVPDTEMTSILCTKNTGIVYFFSMATSFTKAALGAEGVGSDVTMIIGNGYTKGHAEITLQEFRECEALRKIFTELYA